MADHFWNANWALEKFSLLKIQKTIYFKGQLYSLFKNLKLTIMPKNISGIRLIPVATVTFNDLNWPGIPI